MDAWKSVAALLPAFLILSAAKTPGATLGTFTFNDAQFGDALNESDGGLQRAAKWLNVVDVDPGNPGALTGPNFNSGIANIGFVRLPVYTIGYNTPIVNGPGADFGIVSARFISAVQITASPQGDLIRVAGFGEIPDPAQ
jgi:hypothetical protein